MVLGSVSSQQRFGVTDIKALSVSQLSGLGETMLQLSGLKQTMLQLLDKSVLQLCVNSSILFRKQQENPSSRHESMSTQRREEKRVGEHTSMRERDPQPFGSSFYMFFLPLGLPYVNWASQACCLFYLRSSLQSSDLPLFFFVGFSLPCLLATAILDSCFLF